MGKGGAYVFTVAKAVDGLGFAVLGGASAYPCPHKFGENVSGRVVDVAQCVPSAEIGVCCSAACSSGGNVSCSASSVSSLWFTDPLVYS
ncbi:MAG: hypothetical protein QXS68_07285 [Candidatus Methanomethylicaceae archaeon]